MTVENTQNKMPPLQMGTTNEYPFDFAVLLQDPTAEEALEAIKASVLQADGTEIELVYNTDYTVTLNTDRIGGTLTVNDIRTSGDYITIYRQYAQTQEVDYKDFNSAPAETFEQCFDKLTMLSQQQQEEINRSLKFNVSSTIIDPSLPEPIANNTLIWDSVGSSLKNYDIIGENNQFKAEVNAAIISGQADIQAQFDELENVINNEIEDVREAAKKINELEQAVDDAQTAANNAEASASDATQAAISATQAAQNAQTTLNTRANVDLSNLSSLGEKHFLNKSQITNCLLEVPQNIKLELNNGTLTLKAGSKVIVPNGVGVFDEITITTDKMPASNTHTGQFHLFATANNLIVDTKYIESGSSFPSTAVTANKFYNTTENKIYRYDGTEWIPLGYSFPLALVTLSSGTVTSIDQVFNGMGYIGSTVWVDRGVKCLIPDGRNEDGTLRNIELTTSNVFTQTATWVSDNIIFTINPGGVGRWGGNDVYYNEYDNFNYFNGIKIADCFIGTFVYSNGITNFQPKQAFRAVDYNEVTSLCVPDYSAQVAISSPYTAPSAGMVSYSGVWLNAGFDVTVNGVPVLTIGDNATGSTYNNGTFLVSKGDVVSNFSGGTWYFFPMKGAN